MSAEEIQPEPAPTPRPPRRPRYPGRNPRKFHEKYKELDPTRYAADIGKIIESGKTPAGMHRPIMVTEILEVLSPQPGEVAVDCTLGYGGHAREILARIQPGGKLVALDADPIELPRTEARLRAEGFGPSHFMARRSNFAGLAQVLAGEGFAGANLVLADLGVSSMQLDNPARGFTYKEDGPLDMRMNPGRGESGAQLLMRMSEADVVELLAENADEPHARIIAAAIKGEVKPLARTRQLAQVIRAALSRQRIGSGEIELSVRRTFQALRIAVNDELSALETFLRNLPSCLVPEGRVAVLTFHSGEDRRVKRAFQSGFRAGAYSAIAEEVIRSSPEEVRANPRASSAKLRWARRA